MRWFSVTEELVPVDPVVLEPAPLKAQMVLRYGQGLRRRHHWNEAPRGLGALSVALLGDRLNVVGPRQSSLVELLETIRIGRALADRAARAQERRAVALGSSVFPVSLERDAGSGAPVGATARSGPPVRHGLPSTCGLTVHVEVDSPEEGVQVLDRIRIWLPVLLALTANSPFWLGQPSRFDSHRYFSRSQWPAPGPNDLFGSAEEYERRLRHLTHPAAAHSLAATTRDAQLSATRDCVEVLLTDVCLEAEHAAVVADATRALVEVLSRQWRKKMPPPPASVPQLRAASWTAALNGVDGKLLSPRTDRMRSAADVVAELLELIHPVLQEYGDAQWVTSMVGDIMRHGPGSRTQRGAYATGQDLHDVVEAALHGTHNPNHAHGVPGAILAEAWALVDAEEAAVEMTGK